VPAVFNRNYIFRQDLPSPTESYEASQTYTAGFVQSKFHLTPQFEVIAGARVENTDIQLQPGFNAGAVSDSTPVLIDPVTGKFFTKDQISQADIRRTDLLPVLSTTWKFAPNMSLRGSVTRTIARPSFKELAPAFQREPGGTRYIIGNPQLKLSSIVNYDLRAEWLPGGADLFAIGLFSKAIDSPIELFNIGRYYKWGNEPSAVVYGFELEASKDLGTIWENLDGFSAAFNYGYIFSGVSLSANSSGRRRNAGLSSVRRLQGQPDYTLNYDVSYTNQEFGLSASILLNVTGNLLYAVGASDGQGLFGDIFQRPFTSLDFTLSKKLGEHAKLSFKVSNLLNEKRRRTVSPGGLDELVSEEGVTFSLGLSGDW
jgi:TonB-dependent receptor